jgi:hypothetical protein
MRFTTLIVLTGAALLATAAPVLSQIPDDRLIVPVNGSESGSWK